MRARDKRTPEDLIFSVLPTQALWTHVAGMGRNPAVGRGDRRPVENVSWDDVVGEGDFPDRGIDCDPVKDQGWGLLTAITLPGGVKLGVYQPHHPRPGPVDGR
jgi:hypothetical protein